MMTQTKHAEAEIPSHGEATFTKLSEPVETEPRRRAHPRYNVDLEVSLGSDHNFYAGLLENMSVGGLFVATHMLKQIGERMELTIHLPDRETPLRTMGEVRWIREYSETSNVPPGMGIRFVELSGQDLSTIQRFLETREPMLFDDE